MYQESQRCDEDVFSEQRSNLLLVSGNHYNRKVSQYWNRIRENRSLSNEQKLRITKNHIYRISKIRKNMILTHSPGVRILPMNESELQDQKSAELNQAVWNFAKVQQNMRQKVQQFASDYFDIGEVCSKIWWNKDGGELKGFGQAVDETGQPQLDEQGQPLADKSSPVFTGQLEIERFFAMNLLRDANAKTVNESPYLTIRKMVQVEDLKAMFSEEDDRQKMVTESKDETYLIFDENKQGYKREKGITTLRETYFRPSARYPKGYCYIFVEAGILWDMELPFGIFPVVYEGHDEVPTQARCRSPIKQLRPYQVELNRAASSQSEQQVTNGQDKVIIGAGGKLTPGELLPGVRAYHITGRDPIVLEGRTGEQWTQYIQNTIAEMYQAAMIEEEMAEKQDSSDSFAQLFKSMRQKKKFVMDAEKFEGFLTRICTTYLDLAKNYFPDDMFIYAVGKSEQINIQEFRSTIKNCYKIKAEPMSDDLESTMGKFLSINHVLQYNSNQLDREDIGKLIRLMPFLNEEKSFEDFTLNYDRATNMILSLDRGESPNPQKADKGDYMIKRLTSRTTMSDFEFLHPMIKQNYENMIQIYDQMEAEKARQIKAMEADFIPTDGPQIKVAWYIKDPTNPDRSIQATLPANAINWLVERLKDQQGVSDEIQGLNQQNQADIAQSYQQAAPQGNVIGMPTNRGFNGG